MMLGALIGVGHSDVASFPFRERLTSSKTKSGGTSRTDEKDAPTLFAVVSLDLTKQLVVDAFSPFDVEPYEFEEDKYTIYNAFHYEGHRRRQARFCFREDGTLLLFSAKLRDKLSRSGAITIASDCSDNRDRIGFFNNDHGRADVFGNDTDIFWYDTQSDKFESH